MTRRVTEDSRRSIQGDLQYVNHVSGACVHGARFDWLSIAGATATFGGT